jgi:hypothetical protein
MLAAAMIYLVVGIADGDTLTARCGTPESYEQVKVGLAPIYAPEKKQPFGQRSCQALASLCFRQQARLQRVDTDRYGRTVANVSALARTPARPRCAAGGPGSTGSTPRGAATWCDWRMPRPPAALDCGPTRRRCRPGVPPRAGGRGPGRCQRLHHGPARWPVPISTTGKKHYGC